MIIFEKSASYLSVREAEAMYAQSGQAVLRLSRNAQYEMNPARSQILVHRVYPFFYQTYAYEETCTEHDDELSEYLRKFVVRSVRPNLKITNALMGRF